MSEAAPGDEHSDPFGPQEPPPGLSLFERPPGPLFHALLVPAAIGVLLALDVPLRARWVFSKGAFHQAVDRAPPIPPGADWMSLEVPDRIGSYRIVSANRVRGGIIFWEANGALLDDAGFAYLPEGPYPELNTGWFEKPQFRALGGGWYAWTASW